MTHPFPRALHRAHRRPAGRALAALLVSCVTVMGVSACSGSGLVKKATGQANTKSAPVTTETTILALTGTLDSATQEQVSDAVTKVVDGYLDAAYLGSFPRTDFDSAFTSFTDGAADQAEGDLDLLTSASVADRIDRAQATAREVGLDILAVKGSAVGVTAKYDVRFTTAGELKSAQEVRGSLDLTPDGSNWKIFGYHVKQGPSAPLDSSGSTTGSPDPADPTATETSEVTQ